jgi:hypothetical protein
VNRSRHSTTAVSRLSPWTRQGFPRAGKIPLIYIEELPSVVGAVPKILAELSLILGQVSLTLGELSLIIGKAPKIGEGSSLTLGELPLISGTFSFTRASSS